MFADEESETPYILVIKLMYFNLITFYTSSQRFICPGLNLRENLQNIGKVNGTCKEKIPNNIHFVMNGIRLYNVLQ